MLKKPASGLLSSAAALTALAFTGGDAAAEEHTELVIMGTSDVHAHILPYDYMADDEDETIGLSKVYSAVEEIRNENENTMLLDNGDIIQGSILGDRLASEELADDETNPVIETMNIMGYEAAAVGNHEFNFGLEFLEDSVTGADFPWLSANVLQKKNDEPLYEPYTIIEKEINGEALNVGVIGFVPPQIMTWDQTHLEGEVYTQEITDAAERFIPEMHEEGADIIVAMAHTGIDASEEASENAGYQLSQVEGIDAMILGHQHNVFPGSGSYEDIEGIDAKQGTINDVPTAMPGSWGSHLGKISLTLTNDEGEWNIENSSAETVETVEYNSHEDIEKYISDVHEETIEYVNAPVGETNIDLNTYFSRVMDNEVVQIINNAQLDYMEEHLEGTSEEDLPMLSAAAPFRAGRDGNFTNVEAGGIAIKDVNDIYVYPNTLHIVKVNGDELENWLERSAENFQQIDPDAEEEQQLVDQSFSSYNFDIMEGVEYEIDVTEPAGERIKDLTYNGEDVTDEQEFLVATNNYRAGGGGDHLADADQETVLATTDENRQIIIDYIMEQEGPISPEPTDNWKLSHIETSGDIIFKSLSEAESLASETDEVAYLREAENGMAVFAYRFETTDEEEDEEDREHPGKGIGKPDHAGKKGKPDHAGKPGKPDHAGNLHDK
ncbi:bifunctional 2',3'-cyclic-nucleotide 2'-phosphodiesterase/3'-nucleotidase [Alteribacillus sp. JSM 102045]|uniref:bifunctional 2',3'-cyclic-nucleotide 2'-phosphodiesterase/3'-nucleotidase n=1 Tax=Alteribacillus sp. JSM 102045 TaxID=1562101 RepID=UPI0035C14101